MIYTYKHNDIIAGKIPEDIKADNDFSGRFLRYNDTLELKHDVSENEKDKALFVRSYNDIVDSDKMNPCYQVDFVPNVFLGRKQSVYSVGWDNYLKLGEHEDFFIRFGQANRTVYTCRFIQVHHHQELWWQKMNTTYFTKRARVFKYFRDMLSKHNLKRLIIFNHINVNLDENVP